MDLCFLNNLLFYLCVSKGIVYDPNESPAYNPHLFEVLYNSLRFTSNSTSNRNTLLNVQINKLSPLLANSAKHQ